MSLSPWFVNRRGTRPVMMIETRIRRSGDHSQSTLPSQPLRPHPAYRVLPEWTPPHSMVHCPLMRPHPPPFPLHSWPRYPQLLRGDPPTVGFPSNVAWRSAEARVSTVSGA